MIRRFFLWFKNSVGLFIVFFTISMLFTLAISTVISCKEALENNYHFFSRNSVCINFNIPTTADKSRIVNILTEEPGVMLETSCYFQQEKGSSFSVKALYFNEKPYYTPQIIDGRYFNKDDFKDNNNIAVIGKNYINKIDIINNQKYIMFNDKQYKVIGIMGNKSTQNEYDNWLLINLKYYLLNSSNFYNELLNQFEIDNINGNVENTISSIGKKLMAVDNKSSLSIQSRTLGSSNPWITAINLTSNYIIIFFVLIIVLFINIINVSFFWVSKKRKAIGIRKAYGATNGRIIGSMIMEFEIITISASILSVTAEILLKKYVLNFYLLKDININAQNYYLIIVCLVSFSMLIGIISSLIPAGYILKQEADEIIRER